jgi:hypothetical protein
MTRTPPVSRRATAKRQASKRTAPGRRRTAAAASAPRSRASLEAPARKLEIEVVWSEIAEVEADVLLAGHYIDVVPQGAERELDRLVSGIEGRDGGNWLITELTRRRALRGDVGEVMFFPTPDGRLVAVAGMGRLGMFRAAHLRVLALSVAQTIGLLPKHRVLGTVLIGSGKGNLKVREAVAPFLGGLAEALRANHALHLDRVRLVEKHLDRAIELHAEVQEAAKAHNNELQRQRAAGVEQVPGVELEARSMLVDGHGGDVPPDFGCAMVLAALAMADDESSNPELGGALRTVLRKLPDNVRAAVRDRLKGALARDAGAKRRSPKGAVPHDAGAEERMLRVLAMNFRLREPDETIADDIPSRVAFWRSDDDVRAAAITNTTTVVERAISRRAPLVDQACERLQNAPADRVADQADSLSRLVVPLELKEILKRKEALVVEVDRALARVQWEMLPIDSRPGVDGLESEPLAVARQVARQLRTTYSPRPFDPRLRSSLRALVIGDPGGPGAGLLAARAEAEAVCEVLRAKGITTELRLGAPEPGTGAGVKEDIPPAEYIEVIELLLAGKVDIVHFSGHATFDADAPHRTGWIFKDGVLTASDLSNMETAPLLVFANACLSSQISPDAAAAADGNGPRPPRESRLVAGLADEFFKQGVADYIGAAWEIPSDPAKLFATEFYTALLTPTNGRAASLGAAVLKARQSLYRARDTMGPAWGAYQHYGDPARILVPGVVQA